MNNLYSDKCTGCTACASVCPQQCISMEENEEGFKYPVVDMERCISCGLCKKVCTIGRKQVDSEKKSIYAYHNTNEEVRLESTSGGFFSELSDDILKNKGIIYGAVFDKDYNVKHIRATSEHDRNRMRTSKYVQSDLVNIMNSIKKDLIEGKQVLFTGTPCQVSGLKSFLLLKKVDCSKLITCDFICHGVPSPKIWSDYIKFLEKKYKDNITYINFRNKSRGWHKPCLDIKFNRHELQQTEADSAFYHLFYSNCILRKSCHTCEYANVNRVSDITIGDCWGIEKSHKEMDDNKGLSIVMSNTIIGDLVIKRLNKENNFVSIDLKDIRQPHLYAPAKESRKRRKFWEDYRKHKFKYILNKYGYYSLKNKIWLKIKRIIIKGLRK